jgi:hypothetical protein
LARANALAVAIIEICEVYERRPGRSKSRVHFTSSGVSMKGGSRAHPARGPGEAPRVFVMELAFPEVIRGVALLLAKAGKKAEGRKQSTGTWEFASVVIAPEGSSQRQDR